MTDPVVKPTPATLASGIIGCAKNPLVEADRAVLEAMGAERLTLLSASLGVGSTAAPVVPTAAPVVTSTPTALRAATSPSATATATTPAEEMARWMDSVPAAYQEIINRNLAEERARRDNMIARLTSMQTVYTAEVLAAMPTEQLTATLSLLESAVPTSQPTNTSALLLTLPPTAAVVRDFSGLGIGPLQPAAKQTEIPKPYTLALNKGKTAVDQKTN